MDSNHIENNTVYIFTTQTKELSLLLNGFSSLAAMGGLPSDLCVQFIILDSSELNYIKQLIDNYIIFKQQIEKIKITGFHVASILPPYFLKEQPANHTSYLINQYNCHQVGYYLTLNAFKEANIQENDRVIVLSSTSDSHSLGLYHALLAQPWMKQKTNNIQHLCMFDYKGKNTKDYHYRILMEFKNDITLITGLRDDDPYRIGKTWMETIVSLLNLCYSNCSGIPSHNGMTSTIEELPSELAKESIERLDFLYRIRQVILDGDNKTKWFKSLELTNSSDLWRTGIFNTISSILDQYGKLMDDIPSDHFKFPATEKALITNTLNTLPQLHLTGLTEEKKREERMRSILRLILNNYPLKSYSLNETYIPIPDMEINENVFPKEEFLLSISTPWNMMTIAFDKRYRNVQDTECTRSICLDLWEIFFNHHKDEILKEKIDIIEIDLSKEEESIINILEQTKRGKRLKDEKWLYKIEHKKSELSVITSPFTGFAIIHKPIATIIINGCSYFDQIKELKERGHEFQSFLFNYVNAMGNFDKGFSYYIKEQLDSGKSDLRLTEEAKGKNLFTKYPHLRNHVGAEVIIRKNT